MSKEYKLEQARALVLHLEAGEYEQADAVIHCMASGAGNGSDLYNEVGRLTREIHNSMNCFLKKGDFSELAHVEIPDASERLRYVITMTEQAANTTLGAVEKSLPLIAKIEPRFKKLQSNWQMVSDKDEITHQELTQDLEKYSQQLKADMKELHDNMTEVLTAQAFQDLTGQIIRKVIGLVQNIEVKLVELVQLSGQKTTLPKRKAANSDLEGPAVPGVSQGKILSDQDDVDDLLSGLGF